MPILTIECEKWRNCFYVNVCQLLLQIFSIDLSLFGVVCLHTARVRLFQNQTASLTINIMRIYRLGILDCFKNKSSKQLRLITSDVSDLKWQKKFKKKLACLLFSCTVLRSLLPIKLHKYLQLQMPK